MCTVYVFTSGTMISSHSTKITRHSKPCTHLLTTRVHLCDPLCFFVLNLITLYLYSTNSCTTLYCFIIYLLTWSHMLVYCVFILPASPLIRLPFAQFLTIELSFIIKFIISFIFICFPSCSRDCTHLFLFFTDSIFISHHITVCPVLYCPLNFYVLVY